MKTKIFILMMAFLPFSSVCIDAAPVPIILEATAVDPTTDQGEPHRGPSFIPELSLENYTLTFSSPCYGYTLELIDENDVVAYTTIITSDTLVLPSTLSGEYQLRLIPNDSNIYFYGYVMF